MGGMVVKDTIDNLKDKSHDEKKAVASGIAIGVVIILLVGWGFLFLRKIQRGTIPTIESDAIPQDVYDTSFLRGEQERINELYQNRDDQLRDIRDSSAQNQTGTTENAQGVNAGGNDTQFGNE